MEGKKIFITQNGLCFKRKLDADRLARYFQLNSCGLVRDPAEADVILFVSCSVKKSREDECFQLISGFKQYKGELVIVGCLPGIAPQRLKEHFSGRFLMTKDLDKIDSLFPDFKVKFPSISDANLLFLEKAPVSALKRYVTLLTRTRITRTLFLKWMMGVKYRKFWRDSWARNNLSRRSMRQEIYLRISDGCIEGCTYCGIRLAIGGLRSKPLPVIGEEYRALLDKGFRSFRLIADNLGAYGADNGSSFGELLDYLQGVSREVKTNWFLFSLHPLAAIKYRDVLVEKIRSRMVWGIDCPIQSGSDRVLDLMRRRHHIGDILPVISSFRKADPNVALGTHLIVGFPSETDDDFKRSLEAVAKAGFDHVYFYPYHEIALTAASKIPEKVSQRAMEQRMLAGKDYLKKAGITCWYGSLYE